MTEIGGGLGTLIAAILVGLGLKRGDKDAKEIPISPSYENSSIAMGFERMGYQQKIADDTERTADAVIESAAYLKELVIMLRQDRKEKREKLARDHEAQVDDRFSKLEQNQDTILKRIGQLLENMDSAEQKAEHHRRSPRLTRD